MLANYGYTDGSGSYYITIDTDACNACRECLAACPQHIFGIAVDDYDEEKAAVKDEFKNNLKYLCAICKPVSEWKSLPCLDVCKWRALKHSW